MKDLPRETRRAITVATIAAAAMIAQQVAGKTVRDAAFLTYFPATDLPKAMIAGALLSFLGAMALARSLSRIGPHRLAPLLFAFSAVVFVAFWAFHSQAPATITVLLYLHMASLGILVISAFWSVINERFDPHTAKRAIARIVAGSTFGGILGGLLADQVTALVDLSAIFLVLAGLHGICAVALIGFGGSERVEPTNTGVLHGFAVIRRSSYLKQVALIVAVASGLAALLDYAMKAEAARQFVDPDSLVSFFALFYTTTSVLSFAVQRGLGDRTLRRIGLGATMSVLPAAAILGGALGALFTRLGTVVAAKGAEVILANSLFRSGVELLYAPLPRTRKRASKAIVDVVAQRTGDLVGGGFILAVIAVVPMLAERIVLASASVLAVAGVITIARLQRGYVKQLTESLKRGLVTIDTENVLDSTTERTLARHQVEANKTNPPEPALPFHLGLVDATAALISDDPMRQRRALADPKLDPRVAALIIPLLGDSRLSDAAIASLRRIAQHITGQLADALVDTDYSVEIRKRLPRVLEEAGGTRGAGALLLAIGDGPFEIRYHCAKALARLAARDPSLAPPADRIFLLARKELNAELDTWAEQDLIEDDADGGPLEADLARRAGPNVEHLFSLLSLVLEREAIEIALRGWLSEDERMRGTAIEYFENVLPESLRRALAERLPNLRQHSAKVRGT